MSVFILCLCFITMINTIYHNDKYYSILVSFQDVILFMTLSMDSLHWLLLDVYSIVIFEESFACDLLDERYLDCKSHLGKVLYSSEVLERITVVSNIGYKET